MNNIRNHLNFRKDLSKEETSLNNRGYQKKGKDKLSYVNGKAVWQATYTQEGTKGLGKVKQLGKAIGTSLASTFTNYDVGTKEQRKDEWKKVKQEVVQTVNIPVKPEDIRSSLTRSDETKITDLTTVRLDYNPEDTEQCKERMQQLIDNGRVHKFKEHGTLYNIEPRVGCDSVLLGQARENQDGRLEVQEAHSVKLWKTKTKAGFTNNEERIRAVRGYALIEPQIEKEKDKLAEKLAPELIQKILKKNVEANRNGKVWMKEDDKQAYRVKAARDLAFNLNIDNYQNMNYEELLKAIEPHAEKAVKAQLTGVTLDPETSSFTIFGNDGTGYHFSIDKEYTDAFNAIYSKDTMEHKEKLAGEDYHTASNLNHKKKDDEDALNNIRNMLSKAPQDLKENTLNSDDIFSEEN